LASESDFLTTMGDIGADILAKRPELLAEGVSDKCRF
jgi:hypothetical protein